MRGHPQNYVLQLLCLQASEKSTKNSTEISLITTGSKESRLHFKESSFHFKESSFHFKESRFHFKESSFHFKEWSFHFKELSFHFKVSSFHFKESRFHLKESDVRFKESSFRFKESSFHLIESRFLQKLNFLHMCSSLRKNMLQTVQPSRFRRDYSDFAWKSRVPTIMRSG